MPFGIARALFGGMGTGTGVVEGEGEEPGGARDTLGPPWRSIIACLFCNDHSGSVGHTWPHDCRVQKQQAQSNNRFVCSIL